MKSKNLAKIESAQNELFVSPREYFSQAVDTALAKRNLKTYPAVQKYLVDLLEHYLDARNLYDEGLDSGGQKTPSTLAEMYLRANSAEKTEKRELLKKLGDRSLYISGFFGDSLERKIVDIEYYADMGGAAYGTLSHFSKDNAMASKVYSIFSAQFLDFVDVLTYISQQSFIQSDQSILRLYDRYLRTGSELAREKLIEMGVVTVSQDQLKLTRQD